MTAVLKNGGSDNVDTVVTCNKLYIFTAVNIRKEYPRNMNGHLLFNMICVDYWKRYTDKYIHFLTHCHADHTVGLTSTWRFPIYTSLFNAWMLKTKFKINPHRLKPLIIGRSYIIKLPRNGEMSVTLIDANHCPGSVMFLFQGFFGTMLYTGDFRYDPVMLENQALTQVLRNKLLDDLFVDNTYAAEKCKIPSRSKATQEIFEIIRKHPDHVVLLGLRNLGKEELLRAIALEFNEQIYVSEERLQVLQQLMYEDVFTTDCKSCRIHVVDIRSVTVSYMKQRQEEHPHIAILPTALYKYGPDVANHPYKNSAEHGIFVVPYSDHSPYEELFTFISQLKPAKIHPIIEAKQISNNDNRSLSYWQEFDRPWDSV
ncbi:5' exonuclease Apollo-like isoform X5 [Periplaneta americana]|uniref:5' exonuclease Apollo-like isoform X5 n=1 Tax=Periplaneta americana TaxID=6978 RepID=UPI0037E886BF